MFALSFYRIVYKIGYLLGMLWWILHLNNIYPWIVTHKFMSKHKFNQQSFWFPSSIEQIGSHKTDSKTVARNARLFFNILAIPILIKIRIGFLQQFNRWLHLFVYQRHPKFPVHPPAPPPAAAGAARPPPPPATG